MRKTGRIQISRPALSIGLGNDRRLTDKQAIALAADNDDLRLRCFKPYSQAKRPRAVARIVGILALGGGR